MRSISRNIDQLADELPIFLIRLGGIMTALDEKLEWKEFKFCFKVGASKIVGLVIYKNVPQFNCFFFLVLCS